MTTSDVIFEFIADWSEHQHRYFLSVLL